MTSIILGKGVFRYLTATQRALLTFCMVAGLLVVGYISWSFTGWLTSQYLEPEKQTQNASTLIAPAPEDNIVRPAQDCPVPVLDMTPLVTQIPFVQPISAQPVTLPSVQTAVDSQPSHSYPRRKYRRYAAKPNPAFWVVRDQP